VWFNAHKKTPLCCLSDWKKRNGHPISVCVCVCVCLLTAQRWGDNACSSCWRQTEWWTRPFSRSYPGHQSGFDRLSRVASLQPPPKYLPDTHTHTHTSRRKVCAEGRMMHEKRQENHTMSHLKTRCLKGGEESGYREYLYFFKVVPLMYWLAVSLAFHFNSIQFICIAQFHKLQIFLGVLYNLYT